MKQFHVLALLLTVAGCGAPLPQTPPAGVAAQVSAPTAQPGHNWVYSLHDGYTKIPKGTLSYRVSAVNDDVVTVQVQHDGRPSTELYTRGWNWRERPLTNLQNFRYEPPYPALPFPLEAGKTWQSLVQATDPATGRAKRVRIDGAVLGWEQVKVPAGEFDALKVRRLVYAGSEDPMRSQEYISEVDWYAPKLGGIVKSMSSSRYFDRRIGCDNSPDCGWIKGDWNVFELVSYSSR